MIDFTHKNRPDFIQFILIIVVACLALGAITPAASAIDYDDLSYSSGFDASVSSLIRPSGSMYEVTDLPHGGLGYTFGHDSSDVSYLINASSYLSSSAFIDTYPVSSFNFPDALTVSIYGIPTDSVSSYDSYLRDILSYLLTSGLISDSTPLYVTLFEYHSVYGGVFTIAYDVSSGSLDLSLTAFAPDDPSGMYVLSLDGSLLDTTYTVGINRYTSEFKYLVDSYAYTDGSGDYIFTGSRSLTLPIFYNSFTNMPYSYEVSVNVNDENGYLDKRYPVYWSDLGGLYDTVPEALVPTPKPTVTFVPSVPVVPSDIIPDPADLNNTVNITGWYQDMGYEGNNITAPIYSGIRGWFNENLVPVIDFFLTPTNYVATVISDSAETSTDGISYITDELGSYAAPFNTVGAYVVRLVPEVVWLVVFAALSIGYVILLIRVSTGSIKDTIGRFLGGSK